MPTTTDRRHFLRLGSLATLGTLAPYDRALKQAQAQTFNMCGYAAPPLERVRIGFIGMGMRGPGAVERMRQIEGVEIVGICDLHRERVDKVIASLDGTPHEPQAYAGTAYAWKALCDREDVDLIYVTTPWNWHTPMALYAMEAGKHVAVEVPAATTEEECWQLVETSERTRRHCMMLENCCYDFFELMTLNMVRQGVFGELVHGEGAYVHDLVWLNFKKQEDGGYESLWRLRENAHRNGNLYPTHGLGPICQAMNINRGDGMDYLTSLSSNDFNMAPHARELATDDPAWVPYANAPYRGNMNTTMVKTKRGRSIMIQHDVSSPRPYSRIHLLSGSLGAARKWPGPPRVAFGHQWLDEKEMAALEEQYTPEIVRRVGDLAKKVGGHGGMDFIMDWKLIHNLRNGLPLDQDVYDAALWSVIAPLSERSVANRAASVDVPDFTRGAWRTNPPLELALAAD